MTPPAFATIMPEIEARSRRHYAHLPAADQDEKVQESVCQAFALYDSAVRRGNGRFTPASLAIYANRAVDQGRRFAGYTTTDALDQGRSVSLSQLDSEGWTRIGEALVQRWTSPLDQARIRIDWPAFLTNDLAEREAFMTDELAAGSTRSEIARELGLCPSRITQLLGRVAEAYEERFGTPGFERRARRQGRRRAGRQPRTVRAAA